MSTEMSVKKRHPKSIKCAAAGVELAGFLGKLRSEYDLTLNETIGLLSTESLSLCRSAIKAERAGDGRNADEEYEGHPFLLTGAAILALPMEQSTNAAGATSIKDYLRALLHTLFCQGAGFSGKRPFGNSTWEYELYKPLIQAGYVRGTFDKDGYVQDMDTPRAQELLLKAVMAL